jgi:CCR4-NOT transcriptional regulation complex NOT5 subunit
VSRLSLCLCFAPLPSTSCSSWDCALPGTERLAAIPSVEMVRTCASIGTQRTTVIPSTASLADALAQSIGPSVDIPTTGCPADAASLPRKVANNAASTQMPSPEDSGDEEAISRRHVRGLPRRPLSRTAMLVD